MKVIGLTASLGVGKAGSDEAAVNNIMELLSNLDAQGVSLVKEHKNELNRYVNRPEEGL